MADAKPDTITEKDRRVINAIAENPEMTSRQLCEYLKMTMAAYLGTTRKPAFKTEMDKLTNDLLEVTRFQRTSALINASTESTQAAKLVAEMAGEVGRNSQPLESGKDIAEVKTVSTIYKDYQTGAAVEIPDLNSERRTKHPPVDKIEGLPNVAESVLVIEPKGKDNGRKLKYQAQSFPVTQSSTKQINASISEELEAITRSNAIGTKGPGGSSNDII